MDITITTESLLALAQVLAIDLVLAGDNAVVVGLAVAGLPAEQRNRAVVIGIAAATVIRILFAVIAVQLLAIPGLLLAGGLLLLWVCWNMLRELRQPHKTEAEDASKAPKSMRSAMIQIVVADISMSLDNVLAVAGAAKGHPWVLVLGLAISVVLMGFAARWIASLIERHRWIAWAGLLIVLYVAVKMMWDGGWEILPTVRGLLAR